MRRSAVNQWWLIRWAELQKIDDNDWAREMKRRAYDNRIDERAQSSRAGKMSLKLKSRRGFTLAETLLAVLILLLVSAIVATGMPAATNAYNKIVLGANAKVMLSTAITALHDEIGTAWKVETPSETTTELVYFNASTGAKSKISLDTTDHNAIQVQDYLSLSGDLIHDVDYNKSTTRHLVADSNAGMYVTYTGISYNAATGIVSIEHLKVCKKSNGATLVEFAGENGASKDFTIRVISNDAVE